MASSDGQNGARRSRATTSAGRPTRSVWKSATASPRRPASTSPASRAARSSGRSNSLPSAISGASYNASLGMASPRPQGEDGAGGVAEHGRRSAVLLDEGFEVLDLALDGVGGRVAGIAPAPS